MCGKEAIIANFSFQHHLVKDAVENLQVKHWDLDAQTPDIDNRFRRPGGGRPFKMDQYGYDVVKYHNI
ncbi:hypothetical protein PPTG_22234 [Phytophthora nicotianae INRA-310]|uniref:Uncharacterized protein n=1 Tax=Phytophthora nicotianae (strain INRA-310) TaxID=761204 RepID=W2QML4_PHYN3|nr:hypothetical protein PPTG_22234 [Phytophthora nicotianae INRA-310]ETN14353.1 hypothetical protein PPTG_22234 [Phytophthora nicotianae INRA-310]